MIVFGLLAAGLLAAIAFLLLPVVLAVAGTRQEDVDDLDLSAQVGVWGGLLGVRVCRQEPAWELVPTLVGISLGPRIRLGGGQEKKAPDPPTEIDVEDTERADESPAGEQRTVQKKPTLGLLERLRSQVALVRPLVAPFVRLVRAVPSAISLRRISLSAVVGLEDPAATGQMYGLVQALAPAVPRRLALSVTPNFTTPGIHGRAEVRLHLYLGRLLVILGRFGLTAGRVWATARLRTWWALRRKREG